MDGKLYLKHETFPTKYNLHWIVAVYLEQLCNALLNSFVQTYHSSQGIPHGQKISFHSQS